MPVRRCSCPLHVSRRARVFDLAFGLALLGTCALLVFVDTGWPLR